MLVSSLALTPASVSAATLESDKSISVESPNHNSVYKQSEETLSSEPPTVAPAEPTEIPPVEPSATPTLEIPSSTPEEPTLPPEPVASDTPDYTATPTVEPTLPETTITPTPEMTITITPEGSPSPTPGTTVLLPQDGYRHRVVSGADFNCFITNDGGVKCMGNNEFGQLGNGTFDSSNVPVDVNGLGDSVISLTAGSGHSVCALTISGAVKCWGDNSNNVFNNGRTEDRSNNPVDVPGFSSGVQSIELGTGHACAITESNGLFCWGNNTFGQLGSGSIGEGDIEANIYSAREVSGLGSNVQDVTLGIGFTCAVVSGGVKCWGQNTFGQLGNGESGDGLFSISPVDVTGLSETTTAVQAGDNFACAILNDGRAQCWGAGTVGQLGNGDINNSNTPQLLRDSNGNDKSSIRVISSGSLSSCLVDHSDDLYCWGDNSTGMFGENTIGTLTTPQTVISYTREVSLRSSICTFQTDNFLQCWGSNEYGQLGIGTTGGFFTTPQEVLINGEQPVETETPEVEITPDSTIEPGQSILREWWENIDGDTVAELINSPRYSETPSGTEYLPNFESPVNVGDNYGARFRGYVYPPETGDYTFWVNSDDQSELSLSSDDTPENKAKIVELNGRIGWSDPSSVVHLEQGNKYYIEALHKEAGGDDYLSVYWQIPGGNERQLIEGVFLSPYLNKENNVITDANKSTIFASAPYVLADNNQKSTITINLKNSENNPIIGHEVELRHNGTDVIIESITNTTDENGSVQFTLRTGTPQTVTIGAHDLTSNTTLSANVIVEFTQYEIGSILHEWWDGIEGQSISDLTNNSNFPSNPTGTDKLQNFEELTNSNENFGERFRGYINPRVSGTYAFYLASDDDSVLFLSNDEKPGNKRKILNLTGVTGVSDSYFLDLEAGKRYYIEALHKQGTGYSYFRVYWQIPGTDPEVISGNYLSPFIPSNTNENPDPDNSKISSSNIYIQANDSQYATISVTLLGETFEPVQNHEVELIHNGSNITFDPSSSRTDYDGQVQFTLRSGTPQSVTIQAQDKTSGITLSSNVNVIFTTYEVGSILHERWDGIEGSSITDLTGNPIFLEAPTTTDLLTSFEGPNDSGENFGERYRGYIVPLISGVYPFWIESDDDSELWLSTDDREANKTKILDVTGVTGLSQPSHQNLVAGKRYYIEALHKQSTGSSYLKVYWQIPGVMGGEVISSKYLFPYQEESTDPSQSTITSASIISANNTQTATVNVTLVGTFLNPIVGHEVELIHNGSDVTVESSSTTTNEYGRVQFRIRTGTPQTITIQARDITKNITLNTSICVTFSSGQVGSILHEWWNDIEGSSISDLLNNPKYLEPPAGWSYLSTFDGSFVDPKYSSYDNFGDRYRGFIYAPISGAYTFWISSDDTGELWLSTNEIPDQKIKIAEVTSPTNRQYWDTYPSQKSQPINLVAGQKYYIEALHKQNTSRSHLSVAWKIPGQTRAIISNGFIAPYEEKTVDPSKSTVSSSHTVLIADGTQKATISVTLLGETLLPLNGHEVELLHNGTQVIVEPAIGITDANGKVQFTINSNLAQNISLQTRDISNGVILDTTMPLVFFPTTSGTILREWWENVPGIDISTIYNLPKYSYEPSGSELLSVFEGPTNQQDNFVERYSGHITAPINGLYSFAIACNNYCLLYLSSDENPANKTLIQTRYNTGQRNWYIGSSKVNLVAGKKYYIEALHNAGTGSEHLSLAWTIPGNPIELLSNNFISPYIPSTSTGGDENLAFEYWSNVGTISQLLSNSNYPYYPSGKLSLSRLEAPYNISGASNYRGYLIPPQDGEYTFWISSKKASEFWLSSDATFEKKVKIASSTGTNNSSGYEWTTNSAQQSSAIPLVGGQKYYFVALCDSSTENNSLAVAWQLPEGKKEIISGAYLSSVPSPLPKTESKSILREYWIGGINSLTDIKLRSDYPNNPHGREERSNFSGPVNWNDHYGSRYRGYIIPPVSGDYTFWVSSDDDSELYLSSNYDPLNETRIAYINGYVGQGQWNSKPSQQSIKIPLIANRKYYIEALHFDSYGGDHFEVAWQIPGHNLEIIGSDYLSSYSYTFSTPSSDPDQSTIDVLPVIIAADNIQTATASISLLDSNGYPVVGHEVELIHGGTNVTVTPLSTKTDREGRIKFTLRSNQAQELTIQAKDKTSDVILSGSGTITFSNIDPSDSSVTVSPSNVIADGIQTTTLTVLLKDFAGMPVADKSVDVKLKSGRQVTVGGAVASEEFISIGNTNSEGVATAQIASTFAEEKIFDIYGDKTLLQSQALAVFIPGPVSLTKTKFLVEPLTVEADNSHTASISIELKDEQENPIPNHEINLVLTGTAATISQPNPALTDSSGIFIASIKSTDLGKSTILAKDKTENVDIGSHEITWVAGAVDPIKSTVEASTKLLKANGSDLALYIVTLMDSQNHPLSGHQVELSVSGWDNNITGPIPQQTGADGKVTFSLSSTRAETKTLTFRDKTLGITLSQTPVITFVDPSINIDNSCTQPVEGLIDWWPFNGSTNDNAGGYDATLLEDTSYAPGLVGQGLSFDGINDGVSLGNWFDYQSFSVSIWVKPGATQNAYASIINNNVSDQNNWGIQQFGSQTNNYGWLGNVGYLSANKWQHLVITHDADGLSRSYVDGVLTNTTQSGQVNYTGSRFLRLGQSNSGNYWNGSMDEVAIYNRALTQDEIKNIYTSGTAGFCNLTDDSQSIVTATTSPILANNMDTATVNVILRDIFGSVLVGHSVSLNISGEGNTITSTLPVQTNQNGEASFTFTSTRAEEKTVTVRNITQGVVLKTKPLVTFIADSVNPDVSTIEADEAAPANNISNAAVTVTLMDANGNAVAGHEVELTVNGASVTLETVTSTTDVSGKAQFTLRSPQVQTVTIEARDITSDTRLTNSASVEFVSTDPGISSVTANPNSAVADGVQIVTASVTLRDIQGQPVVGKPVTLKIKSGTQISINGAAAETDTVSLGNTDTNGTVSAQITSTKAESKAFVIYGDRLKLDQELNISFTPGPVSVEKTIFSIDPLFLVGDGIQEAAISIELKDAFENPISGHDISITSTGVNATITQPSAQTDTEGKLTATIKSAELGNALVKATDTTENITLGDPIEVGFVNGLTDPVNSTVTVEPITVLADGVEKATIIVTLLDSTGHPLPGHEVELTSTGTKDSILGPVPLVTSADGKATFSIASTQSGIKTLTIRDKTIKLALKTAPKVTFNPGPVSLDKILLTANPTQAPADGITPITLTATARDINENPVPGVPLTLNVSGTTAVLTQSALITDEKGQITATVKDTVIEKVTATILYNDTPVQASVELSFRGPDISAVLSGPEKAAPGTEMVYTIFVQNKNLMSAEGVNVELQLPADVTFVKQDSPIEPTLQENKLKWDLGNLAGSNSIQFKVITELSKTIAIGSELEASAVVTSTMDDGNPANNQSIAGTTIVDALKSEASISPAFSSLPIGGETTYTITIRNTGLNVDTFDIAVEGLPEGWITLDRSFVYLNSNDTLDVHMKVAMNSCQFEEEIPFTVKVTATQAAKTTTLNAKLMIVTAPQVWIDSPRDKSTLGSTSVLFSWRTNPASSGVITLYPEGHPELAQTLNSEMGTDHSVTAENLTRNTTYFWKLNSTTSCGESGGGLRQFRVENGIVFTQIPADFTIDRDYNQILKIYAKNEDVVLHSLKADLVNPSEDLIANFVGSGSIDEVINLGPGETRELSLAVHAQDTTKSSYLLTAHLLTDGSTEKPIEDNAKIKVNILSSGDFKIEEDISAYDPKFMAHTYIITNNGSTITDLSLKAVDPVTGLPARIFLKPSINHARLERGKTLKVVAYPLFDASDVAIDPSGGLHSEIFDTGVFLNSHKREISALIKAEGAGNTKTTNADVNCPAGKNVFEVTHRNQVLSCSSEDWYCTNRPNVTTNVETMPGIKEADIESASISVDITPRSEVLPHNGKIDLNSTQVGLFENQIPKGNFTFEVDPKNINSAVAGAVPQQVKITTQHMNNGHYVVANKFNLQITVKAYTAYICAGSQEEADTIKPPLCEFIAAKVKEGILDGNVLVDSSGMKLTNGGPGDTGDCPYAKHCNAMHVVADPINTKTGGMSFSAVDLSVPTSAGTLAFQRSYSSAATTIFRGVFGPGWTHNHDARLIFPEDANGIPGYVLFKSILGNLFYFKINDDGTYTPLPGVTAALTRDGQGDTAVYSIKSRAQTNFTFDAKGKALTRSDSQGNTFSYTYDGNGKLSRISADGGQRYIELTYDAQGRVSTATDHAGRQVAYHYNPNGDLNDITDILGKTWSYLYDSAHRITKTSDPDGTTITTDYDMQGRAYRQFDGKGNQMVNIVYNADGTSTVTDANGKTSKDTYDKFNTLTGSLDPLGGTTSTQRDANYNPTSITDPSGHTTGLVWSADGANLTQVTDAAGQTSNLTYDSFNNLTGVTDTAGHQTQYFYEDSSHPTLVTRIVDAQGTETSYEYDGNGRLTRTTDPLGHSTSYGYDSFGQRTSVTDAMGHSTSSSYDNLGRMTDSTGIDGLTTHYEYDVAGHMTKSTRNYAPGRGQNESNLYNIVTTYEYDSVGNQTAVTDTLGATTRYEYDENNRLVKTIDPAGNETRSVYNAAGQLVESVDALGRSTDYSYDALGRVTITTAPDGSTTRSEYNPDGTVAASIDASGARTTYTYDALKRTIAIEDAMGNETHTSYDAAGNVQSSTDAMGNTTSYEYDALGRVVNTTSPDGSVTHTEYNSAGQTVSTTRNYDAGRGQNDGNIYNLVTSYTYDELGRQKTVTDTLGNTTTYNYDAAGRIHSVTDAMGRTTTYEYDSVGRQSAVIDPMGGRSSQSFDVLGRVTASTDMAGRTTSYDFDALGRQTAVTDAAGGRVSYTYDAAGQRLTQTDANGNTTTFTYDSAGRTLTTTDANGKTVTNEYGSGGRLLSVTNGNGEKTRYEYDALSRQTAVTDPLGNVTRYTYNANGQRVMMTDANGVATQYGYDAAGRLTDVIENYMDGAPSDAQTNVHTHYAYDLNGSRTSITDGNGNVTSFEYDALGRQTAESDALGHTTRYTYDASGNRATQVDAMGRTTSYEYNARGQLTRIVYPAPDPAVVFSYNDATGQRISMDDGIGRTTWNYDALGRVTSVTDPFGKTVAYEYDNVGNRTGLTYPDGKVVNYTYDPANRLQVVKDWLEQVTTYGYDSANRLNLVALPNGINSNYTYDSAGHLTNLTHAAQDRTLASYTYTYDATGNRTSAVEDMVTLEGKPPYVSVFVKDTDGNAVVGAPVYAFTGTNYSGKTAATDANGEARLTLPFGNYRFRVDIKDQTLNTNTAQFWSTSENACVVEGCHKVFVTVNKPVTVSVTDSSGLAQAGLPVYAFLETPKTDGSGFTETYSGISGKTGADGQISLVLPFGQYRFRGDLNNTQFWSSPATAGQLCDVSQPAKVTALQDGAQSTRCTTAAIQVSIPTKVTVASTDGDLLKDIPVYAFTGTTYSGISAKTDANGEVTFTLPFGNYRFRADYKPEGAASSTQFWSGTGDHCTLPGCSGATVAVTKPFAITVQDTDGTLMSGISVYAFSGSTYKGYHGVTDGAGKVVFSLPEGSYRFRADFNSTQFWSSTGDECVIPGCPASAITVTKPLTVTVRDTGDAPMADISVYAFDGTTYKGYSKKTSASGQAMFTLPLGNYRFRADYNGTQFWSGEANHCTLPGCTGAGVTLTRPVIVTALDSNDLPAAGISLYAFNGTTYKGYSGKTSAGGQVSFTLPLGSYRFRGDYNGKQYWSSAGNDCALPGCSAASVKLGAVVPTLTPTALAFIPTMVTDFIGGRRLAKPVDVRPRMDYASSGPVVVTVLDTDGQPLFGMPVYAFTGSTYTGKHGVTDASGQANIILPAGSYRFRSDRNGTRFWSSEADTCTVPDCAAASITVTRPVTVTVRDTDGQPQAGIAVYAFDGTTYKGISGKTDANGIISLTLPVGSFRFRGDLNGTKFWSSETNECVLPGCTSAAITLSKPVTVTVKDTAGAPKEGLTVYAFDGTTYKGINGKTDVNGNVTLTLPQGSYRFRADLNGTHFWSGADNHCALPGCSSVDVAVTIPLTVRVEGVDHSPFEGVKVHAFDGTTYKGYSGTSGKDGQVTFTLPQGTYRFRGDLNGTQFWSSTENACALPGCASAAITLPGGNTSRNTVTINYTYDGLSRLTAADYSNGDYYHYAYDSVGNRLTETTTKGETAYTYDTANRLTSVNGQAVQWDDNGNMLADGQAVYTYNAANKLVGVTKGTSSIVYAYSGLGDRLRQIADGVTTDYTLDINAGLTQVLDDGTNKYLYGNQRISQIAETQTGYFLPDALGSMRQMTDPSADLTLARSYDPYGNMVSSSGASETVYGYTGEMQTGGLVHLRARDYVSQLGRFTSRDTWEGDIFKPNTLGKWNYANSNPLVFIDSSGKCPICIILGVVIISSVTIEGCTVSGDKLIQKEMQAGINELSSNNWTILGRYKAKDHFNKAINLVISKYKIDVSNVNNGGPHYDQNGLIDQVYPDDYMGIGGLTLADNTVLISYNAFKKTDKPREAGPISILGSIIFHETIHTNQNVRGLISSDRQLNLLKEFEAYTMELENINKFNPPQEFIIDIILTRRDIYINKMDHDTRIKASPFLSKVPI